MKVNFLKTFLVRSIGRDFLFGIFAVIIINALVVGSINYYVNSEREIHVLKEQAEKATENLAGIIAHSIYNSNHSETSLIGEEYKQMLNVVSVTINDEKHNTSYQFDSENRGRYVTVIKPIGLFGKRLGSVEIKFSTNAVIRQQKEFLLYTAIVALCTIFVVGITSILLADILFRKPFSRFIHGVNSIASGTYERIAPMKHHYLNLIAQSVNVMADNIAIREQHQNTLVKKLEKQIAVREQAEKELLIFQDKLRSLSNELLLTEERERRRISSELHDRIGHALTSISMKINLVENTDDPGGQMTILKDISKLIEQSIQDVQSLIFDISPPVLYDFGIVPAIDWLIEQTSGEYGLNIILKCTNEPEQLDNSYLVLAFRAIRELLFNVVKHAEANQVEVSIELEESDLIISVQDDGIGMSETSMDNQLGLKGFGLFNIMERLSYLKGQLTINSKPHGGTQVTMKLPIT